MAGLGSACGADAFGWEVIRALQAHDLPGAVNLLQCHHPAEMLTPMLGADTVIVVDAFVGAGEPGRICRISLDDIESGSRQVHGLGVAEVLHLGLAMGLSVDRLHIFGLPVPASEVALEPEWIHRAEVALLGVLARQLAGEQVGSVAGGA